MLDALQGKLQAIQEMTARGISPDKAAKQYNERRTAVLRKIGEVEYAFVKEMEAGVGSKAMRDYERRAKSQGGYLIAALEAYKSRDYNSAVGCCNGALSYDANSAKALALRGLVLAAQIAPSYSTSLADLDLAVGLEPENALYKKVREIVHAAIQQDAVG
jgi:tetratricopeptide (TPR) repeat protein